MSDDKRWDTKTPDEILADVKNMFELLAEPELPQVVERTHEYADGAWVPDVPYPAPPAEEKKVTTYDPAKVTLSFGGVQITGYADGSFIEVEPTRDIPHGAPVRAKAHGAITLTLMGESKGNHALLDLLAAERARPHMIIVGTSGEPDYLKDTSSERFWVFDVDALDPYVRRWVKPLTGRQRTRRLWRKRGRR